MLIVFFDCIVIVMKQRFGSKPSKPCQPGHNFLNDVNYLDIEMDDSCRKFKGVTILSQLRINLIPSSSNLSSNSWLEQIMNQFNGLRHFLRSNPTVWWHFFLQLQTIYKYILLPLIHYYLSLEWMYLDIKICLDTSTLAIDNSS
jgi:hypothetical protein